MVRTKAAWLLLFMLATGARAEDVAPAAIRLHDLPGTGGEWQEGAAIIPAPRDRIRAWLTGYAAWPSRFPDIEWSQVLPDDERGLHVIRFRSRIADAVITVHESVRPELLAFHGRAWFGFTQGRIHLVDLGDGTTLVLMQSTATARGIARLLATRAYKRRSAFEVTCSHLAALDRLARGAPLEHGATPGGLASASCTID